jgi:ribosomal protein L40E
MIPPQCPFCYHSNPAGAKFCNDCGSPLHLKPCRQCDAINDQAARKCYKCGTEDPTLVTTPDAPLVSLVADSTAAPATPSDVSLELGHPPLSQSAPEGHDVRSPRQGNATAIDCESGVEVVTDEPRSLGEDVSSLVSETLRTTHAVPSDNVGATAGRHPMSRAVLAGFPPVVLLIAVALTAYHVYLHPLQLREWLSAIRAPMDGNPGGLPTQSIPGTIGVPASPAPPADLGTGSVAGISSAGPAPPNKAATDVTPSPVRQDGTLATGLDSAGGQTLAPDPTRAAVMPLGSATDQVLPPTQLATQAEKGVGTSGAATAIAAEPRDTPAIIPPHVTRPGGCTEAIAALGPCSSKKTSTNAKTTAKKSKKTPTKKLASTQAPPAQKASTTTIETAKTTSHE